MKPVRLVLEGTYLQEAHQPHVSHAQAILCPMLTRLHVVCALLWLCSRPKPAADIVIAPAAECTYAGRHDQ